MFIDTTPEGFSQYQIDRKKTLPKLIEHTAILYGLPNIAISIDVTKHNNCELTQDGIHITINPDSMKTLIHQKRFGTRGVLPLALADLFIVMHEMHRAGDYKDPTFFIELDETSIKRRTARIFFVNSIDDIVIDAHLSKVPLLARYQEAFNSRFTKHDLTNMPQHIQFINALRIYLLEKDPALKVDPVVASAVFQPNSSQSALAHLKHIAELPCTYEDRHRLADEHLYPSYLAFFKQDLASYDLYSINEMHKEESNFSELKNVNMGDLMTPDKSEVQEYNEELYRVTEERLEQSVLENIEQSEDAPEGSDDGSAGLVLPRTGESPDDLEIVAQSQTDYTFTVQRWHAVISDIADLFLRLATPKESLTVPRYRPRATIDGARLNPQALVQAQIQLITGSPRPIWQPIEKQVRHQELQFSGLDVYLLLDVSGSMGGSNAEYATAMAVCLIEGLQLARTRAEADPKQSMVDVRTQLLAFGAGWAELTSLCKEPTFAQKETAHYNLMNPSSNFTAINGALKKVRENALEVPERNVICLVVSDGLFSDNLLAFKTIQSMPNNVYVGHISIGDALGIPITLHSEIVYDPKVLPKKLQAILADYFIELETRITNLS